MCIDLDTILCNILTLNRSDEIAIIFFIHEICYYICIFSIKFKKNWKYVQFRRHISVLRTIWRMKPNMEKFVFMGSFWINLMVKSNLLHHHHPSRPVCLKLTNQKQKNSRTQYNVLPLNGSYLEKLFSRFSLISITNTFVSLTFSNLFPRSDALCAYIYLQSLLFLLYSVSKNGSDGMVCGRVAYMVAFFSDANLLSRNLHLIQAIRTTLQASKQLACIALAWAGWVKQRHNVRIKQTSGKWN